MVEGNSSSLIKIMLEFSLALPPSVTICKWPNRLATNLTLIGYVYKRAYQILTK